MLVHLWSRSQPNPSAPSALRQQLLARRGISRLSIMLGLFLVVGCLAAYVLNEQEELRHYHVPTAPKIPEVFDLANYTAADYLLTLNDPVWWMAGSLRPSAALAAPAVNQLAPTVRANLEHQAAVLWGEGVPLDAVEQVILVFNPRSAQGTITLNRPLDVAALTADKEIAETYHGIPLYRVKTPRQRLFGYFVIPRPELLLVATQQSLLHVMMHSVENSKGKEITRFTDDPINLQIKDLRALRSRIQAASAGGSSDRPLGLLARFRVEDWAKDITGGTVKATVANGIDLSVVLGAATIELGKGMADHLNAIKEHVDHHATTTASTDKEHLAAGARKMEQARFQLVGEELRFALELDSEVLALLGQLPIGAGK